MRIWARALATGAVALASLAAGGGVAGAQTPAITVGADGETSPVFSYQDAIRERVFIPVAGLDQDANGTDDRIAIDIVRPKESGPNLKVPAIIDDSPYYTSVGRGNETQYIHTTPNGTADKFPLFYDNYFVPRGYAMILAQADGTAFSTGCALHGGPGDVAGFKAVIDWTEGRIPGYTSVTGSTPVTADWSNGKNAMIGKSYDGTFANGVAATGVDGLTTIVPISAISDWYDYSRMGGIRFQNSGTHYPTGLSQSIAGLPSNLTAAQRLAALGVLPPDHLTPCSPIFTQKLSANDGDADGDVNQFWEDRNYFKDVSKVKAAVFESHGINDDNVRPQQMSQWWAGLSANNVPRKLWLSQEGHVDPFDYRRVAWVDTLHRWFDYWLQGVQNGIMNEPMVDIEQPQGDVWKTYASYPIPDTVNTDVYLNGRTAGNSGSLGLAQGGGATDTQTFADPATGNPPSETTDINTPNSASTSRLVYLTTKLTQDLHISGTPLIDLQASLSKDQTNLTALLVDYGAYNRPGRGGADGVSNTTTRTCWGQNSTDASNNVVDSACYLEVSKPSLPGTSWRVSRGQLDSSNRDSLFSGQATPATIGQKYEFKFPILPTDYTFPAGHQIGVIVVTNDTSLGTSGTRGTAVTLDTRNSKLVLPVTGGGQAATASGGFVVDTTAPVLAAGTNQTFNTTDLTGVIVNYTRPTATDTQDDAPTVNCTPAAGTKFAIGTRQVTCTATDANGNSSAPQSFNVTVQYATQANGDVNGSVPAALSLSLGNPAAFGGFTPGKAQDYIASTSATVVSTAGNAALTVADPSATNTGHLVNGTFSLPQVLMAQAASPAAGAAGPFAAVGGSAAPTLLASWTGPASNDPVTLTFKQTIGQNDALRTGTYSKTLTFTLSTTNP